MSVVDVANKTITLKIVYYGCALGGKTTNLETLHKLTDPDNEHGLLSIATQDDRTLFFDLLPMELGQVSGLAVRSKIYTVPGQVHYELTRRQVLAAADGVVLVVDSSPQAAKANAWAAENLRHNLKANGLDPATIPTVIQYNKRDLPDARPVDAMQPEVNARGLPTSESVATTGAGVVDTYATILKLTIVAAYKKAGRKTNEAAVAATVEQALEKARQREPSMPATPATFEHRVDMEAYRDQWADQGRDRRVMDQDALLAESVQTSMELAERLDGFKAIQALSERRQLMLQTLGRLAPMLVDPGTPGLPQGVVKTLLAGAGRKRGSMLLFQADQQTMVEREVLPEGRDPLNAVEAPGVGSVAWRLGREGKPRWIQDLASEVFFDTVPPGAEGLGSAYLAPLQCDGLAFGSLLVYADLDEAPIDDAVREYLDTAATLISLSLHWKALRRKLLKLEGKVA